MAIYTVAVTCRRPVAVADRAPRLGLMRNGQFERPS
jgi:hypothetical protein